MAEGASNTPKQSPQEVDSYLQRTTDALKQLKTSVENKVNEADLKKSIDTAATSVAGAKEYIKTGTYDAVQQLKSELNLLPETLRQLPTAVQETAADGIEELQKQSNGLWQKLGGEKALNFAKTTISSAIDKSGLNTVLTKIGDVMGKVGEFANSMWESLKPHLSRMAETPGIAFLIGKENLSSLQSWLGYDGDTIGIQDAFRSRLGKNVTFAISTKKEAQLFKDVRTDMLKKNGKKAEEYTFDSFVQELMKMSELQPFTNDANSATELPMTTILAAAKTLAEKTPQSKPEPETKKEESPKK